MGSPIGPLTVNSAGAPFVTGAQFIVMYDWRTPAMLLSDTDTALATATDVANNTTLLEILMEAAGQIEMATSKGNRYQPSDLTTLAGSTTVMGSRLRRLNADIAMEMLWRRRPDKEMPAMPQFEEAQAILASLENGDLVFGFQQTMDAGIVQDYVETASDVDNRNLPTFIAQNLFGRRGNRIPPPGATGGWSD